MCTCQPGDDCCDYCEAVGIYEAEERERVEEIERAAEGEAFRARFRIELERRGLTEREWAMQILGARSWYVLTRVPLNEASELVHVEDSEDDGRVTRLGEKTWRTPVLTVDEAVELYHEDTLVLWDSVSKVTLLGGIGPDVKLGQPLAEGRPATSRPSSSRSRSRGRARRGSTGRATP